jgi:hypothetical protein
VVNEEIVGTYDQNLEYWRNIYNDEPIPGGGPKTPPREFYYTVGEVHTLRYDQEEELKQTETDDSPVLRRNADAVGPGSNPAGA